MRLMQFRPVLTKQNKTEIVIGTERKWKMWLVIADFLGIIQKNIPHCK